MKGFLYRDLCGVKRISKFIAIMVVLFSIMGIGGTMQLLVPIYFILVYVNQLVEEDERSGWIAFASVVPNGRQQLVRSKYRILLLTAGGVLVWEVLFAAVLAGQGKQGFLFGMQVGLVAVGVAVLIAEISLPAMYSFGYRDGAFFTVMMAVVLLFIIGRAAYSGMQAHDWNRDLQGLNIMVIVPLAAIIALRPSYRASVSACERREF